MIIFVATVLTVYGIETHEQECMVSRIRCKRQVATVLTVYGIETSYKEV